MYKNFKEFVGSKLFQGITIGVIFIAFTLTVFQVGVKTGYDKAKFAGKFGDNFHKNFVDPRGSRGPLGQFGLGQEFLGPDRHGAVGKIVSVSFPLMVVAGPDNLEKTVVISEETLIRKFESKVNSSELKVDDFVVVLGDPNEDGQINAKLIRMVPPPLNSNQETNQATQ